MDPIVGSIVTALAGPLLKNIFNPGPSAAQIAAAAAAAQAAKDRQWLIGGGIVAGALVLALLVSRR
jgi:hypothetical protein